MSKNNVSKHLTFSLSIRDFLKVTGAAFAYAVINTFPSVSKAKSQITPLPHDKIIRMNLIEGVHTLESGKISAYEYGMAAVRQANKFKEYNIFT